MPEPERARRPLLDQVLEYALYVPLGAALRVAEQVPELAASGRAVAGRSIDNARVIGRFAVGAARRQVESRLSSRSGEPSAPVSRVDATPPRPAPTPRPVAVASDPSGLAVPGYDALAASQVVPLLTGLSPAELAEIQHYEESHRARRTVLGRIAQLQEERGDASH